MTRPIGIDLGTTYTVVATLEKGKPVIIPNAEGQRLTPSVVAFTPDGATLVGQSAKAQSTTNPTRTIASFKRHMGSDYRVRIDKSEHGPTEMSSLVLRKVVADTETHLSERIEQVVITVPAYFNDRQRQATREAGALAGLDVLRVLSEPTATALAYGLQREDAHTVLVWDLGGGTFDVSILDLGEGIFQVRAVSGDAWLGGDDWDRSLVSHLAREYERAWGMPCPEDPSTRQHLLQAAEWAKVQLSATPAVKVSVPLTTAPTGERRRLETELTRQSFEHVTSDLLQRMVPPVQQALKDAGLKASDIDRVILAGGATRMPALRKLVRDTFGREPYRYLNPDEVVAQGAAIEAGRLLGAVDRVVLLDVLPLSLGVETAGGLVAQIIPRNSPLPAKASRLFTTAADGQTSMDIHVLQGERSMALDNVSLGKFTLAGIPEALRGYPKVEVSFEADVDGIVHVSACDLATEEAVTVKVAATKLLDAQEIASLAEEARRMAEHDRQERERIQAGVEAENALAASGLALASPQLPAEEGRALRLAAEHLQAAIAGRDATPIRERSGHLRQLLAAVRGT